MNLLRISNLDRGASSPREDKDNREQLSRPKETKEGKETGKELITGKVYRL